MARLRPRPFAALPALLGLAATLLGLFASPVASAASAAAASTKRPNIILYLADDLGYNEVCQDPALGLGFPLNFTLGVPIPRPANPAQTFLTPNVNRLATQSMRMWRMYAPSSICAPSRSSIFTGRNVGMNKIRTNYNFNILPNYVELNETVPSFAQTLHDIAGYETAYFGKWGLGAFSGAPYNHGFNTTFFGYLREGVNNQLLLQFPQWLSQVSVDSKTNNSTMQTITFPSNVKYPPTELMCAIQHRSSCVNGNILFRSKALKFLSDRVHATTPFLLVWAPTTPHASPYSYGTKATSTTWNLGWRQGQFPPHECKRGHAAQIEQHIDVDIQMLLNLLEANPSLNENTLLVFSSDNGPHSDCADDPTYTPLFFEGNGGLRGWKHYIYEGGLRVPTFVRWPGKVKPGSVSIAVQTLYDLDATFQEVAGIVPARPTGGVSLLPIWLKGDSYANPRPWAHFEFCDVPFNDSSCSTATLDTQTPGHLWKLVVTPTSPQDGELYDLLIDITESHNLAQQLPSVLQRMWTLRAQARISSSAF